MTAAVGDGGDATSYFVFIKGDERHLSVRDFVLPIGRLKTRGLPA
jgi:hypothetical protein